MNIGTVAYTCISGLGLLAKRFFDKGLINRVYTIPHPNYRSYEWYPAESTYDDIGKFLQGLDGLLIFENAFRTDIVRKAKKRGIKIILMPMYEYTPWPFPIKPDGILCPSNLDFDYYTGRSGYVDSKTYAGIPCFRINVPVEVPYRQRTQAKVFIHNAGHGGKSYRNGTLDLIQAMKHVKTDIKLIIRAQHEEERMLKLVELKGLDDRIRLQMGTVRDEAELYSEGDVFIFPERFNGLSLPLQEAYAAGMLVMATNRYPMDCWLPIPPLISPSEYKESRIAVSFKEAIHDPKLIAAHIDQWALTDVSSYSELGLQWGINNSWAALLPLYQELIQSIIKGVN